jgi:hypothetical protein
MKNKRYRVWMANYHVVDIDAKEIQIIYLNDKPLKIKFVGEDDYTLAEFYCDMISGWAQIDCIPDYTNTP